jgi:hypothetical protein
MFMRVKGENRQCRDSTIIPFHPDSSMNGRDLFYRMRDSGWCLGQGERGLAA